MAKAFILREMTFTPTTRKMSGSKREKFTEYFGWLVRNIYSLADEYAWRYNNGFDCRRMFEGLLKQITEVKLVKVEWLV